MLFNSQNFVIFLPIVFILYWFVTNKYLQLQNVLLLVSSYFFYACWDWRFLFLLIFSTSLDYFTGNKIFISKNQKVKKNWLLLSILINVGFLGFFKYYNFFVDSLVDSFSLIGLKVNPYMLDIILPVGISFYTFHGLSYIIDIYNGKIKAEKNFINYSVFVSFFPLLVAGPIERATHLLPQIQQRRKFDFTKAIDGLRQILWGLFKKIVIADQCALFVDQLFSDPYDFSGSTLAIGAILFAFQIYGDFSGYSDIALGTAKLFGIDLLRNFAFPYFSRSIPEFWRRWHISLSTWFRDYLYIPMGGSRASKWKKVKNIFILFIISGFWHGANWTFIIWGILHAFYMLPSILLNTNRKNLNIVAQGKILPSIKEFVLIVWTFILVAFALIFFRADNVTQAISYISILFSNTLFTVPTLTTGILPIFIIFFLLVEWLGRDQQYAIANLGLRWPESVRWAVYYLTILIIFYYSGSEKQFIYFQF
jgi:alginate O-acetyltransferase complex protein AlgI